MADIFPVSTSLTLIPDSASGLTDTIMNYLTNLLLFLAPYKPFLAPTLVLSVMLTLAFVEIKVKLELRALQILLNKDSRAQRRVLVINCAQSLVQIAAAQLVLVSPELQVVTLYTIVFKSIQTNMELIKADAVGLISSFIFVFIISPTSSISIIGELDGLLTYLSTQAAPLLVSFSLLILIPLSVPVLISSILFSAAWMGIRLIVAVRRKFPEDFDFFVTIAMFILAWKILQKDIMQRQVKSLVCTSLEKSRNGLSVGGTGSGLQELRRWCKQPPLLGDIVQVGEQTGYFGSLENVSLPQDVSYPEMIINLAFNYRIRMSLIVSSLSIQDGCNLTVTNPPRDEVGFLTSALYRLYLLAAWVTPTKYQSHLAVFGFNSTKLVLQTQISCLDLFKQLLIEKIN
jgi:hypothetical protein